MRPPPNGVEILVDSGWNRFGSRTAAVHGDERGLYRDLKLVYDHERLIKFANTLTAEQLQDVCRWLENSTDYPGAVSVRAQLVFGSNSTPVEWRFITHYLPMGLSMLMHLTLTTPSGITLLVDANLTGDIDMCAGNKTVAAVEVMIDAACVRMRGDGPESLPGPAIGVKRLWVRPDDLCWNGQPLKHEELIEAANKKRQLLGRELACGPLPENWP